MDQLTELTQLAAAAMDAPVAAVSLVDAREACVLAGVGIPVGRAIARAQAMCGEVVGRGAPFVLNDVSRHPGFATGPMAVEDGARFYAGWPLTLDDRSEPIATLFVVDHRPRRLGAAQRRTLEMLARQAAAQLRPATPAADRLRDDFIALVSHEVRTPLAAIQGYVEMLLDELPLVEDRHARFAGSIQTNVRRLVRLIDQLLLTASATTGSLTLRSEHFDLRALTDDVLLDVAPLARTGEVALGVAARGNPVWVVADRALVSQAVDNVIRNGVRFTAPGGRVDVSVSDGPPTVEVIDSGVGIPAEEQGRVFDRFFRGAYAEMHAVPGAGLGLSLVKAVADAHNAKISLTSNANQGTYLALTFP